MKIDDLAGNKVVVYDSNLERFSRFFRRLEKLGYIWRIENSREVTFPLGEDVVIRPCVFITSNHRIFIHEIATAVKENFLIVPTLSLDDFAEYEHRWESEQAEKIRKLIAEAFPNPN